MFANSPATVAIQAFGGCRRLAALLGKSPSTISRWNKPRKQQGTGGHIPTGQHLRLLELARAMGVDLTAEDLIYGRRQ